MDEQKTASTDYLKTAVTIDELKEEMDTYAKDLRDAEFIATMDIVRGVKEAFSASMQVYQDLIERLEEKSPDPENDPFITSMYNVYNALEDMRGKCDYL